MIIDPTSKDEYYTPKWIFDGLDVKFDLDVCCPHDGAHAADKWICGCCGDGLVDDWYGNVWMNPPYSKPTPWIDKFIDHRNGIALTVASKSKWFHKIWNDADAVTIMPVNLKFERLGGLAQIQFPCVMFAYGEQNVQALKRLNTAKTR